MVENYYQRASSRNPLILVEKCFTNTPKVENKSPMATVFQVAASSEIGVARAAYFPQISLSGVQSSALSNLFQRTHWRLEFRRLTDPANLYDTVSFDLKY